MEKLKKVSDFMISHYTNYIENMIIFVCLSAGFLGIAFLFLGLIYLGIIIIQKVLRLKVSDKFESLRNCLGTVLIDVIGTLIKYVSFLCILFVILWYLIYWIKQIVVIRLI